MCMIDLLVYLNRAWDGIAEAWRLAITSLALLGMLLVSVGWTAFAIVILTELRAAYLLIKDIEENYAEGETRETR